MRKRIIFYTIALLIIAGILLSWRFYNKRLASSPVDSIPHEQGQGPGSPNSTGQNPVANNNPDLPKTLLLKVPFTPQAPTANWDQLHNEACEEASSLMAGLYFAGDTDSTIPPEQAESEISKLTQWEQDNFGYSLDTDSPETAKMIEANYNLKTKLLHNFTVDDLKSELAQNHLIVISFDGRLLHNPNYRQPGPPHHMLVIKGYNSTGIITNDPGTRKGMNYSYNFQTMYDAAGDWDHSINAVDLQNKVAIIVWKE